MLSTLLLALVVAACLIIMRKPVPARHAASLAPQQAGGEDWDDELQRQAPEPRSPMVPEPLAANTPVFPYSGHAEDSLSGGVAVACQGPRCETLLALQQPFEGGDRTETTELSVHAP